MLSYTKNLEGQAYYFQLIRRLEYTEMQDFFEYLRHNEQFYDMDEVSVGCWSGLMSVAFLVVLY